MKLLNLLRGETIKFLAELKRYFFDTISGVVVLTMLFLLMFYGIRFFAGPDLGDGSLDSLVIGYILWLLALMGYQKISYLIREETERGTMEQLYLCSFGIEWPLIIRTFLESIYNLILCFAVLLCCMLITGIRLDINFLHFVGVLLISLPSLWGLGLILGSLTLLLKKIGIVSQFMQFAMIGLVAVNAYPINVFSFLPFASGATTIRAAIVHGTEFPLYWYVMILAINLVYFFAGVIVYKSVERLARKRNLLCQY